MNSELSPPSADIHNKGIIACGKDLSAADTLIEKHMGISINLRLIPIPGTLP